MAMGLYNPVASSVYNTETPIFSMIQNFALQSVPQATGRLQPSSLSSNALKNRQSQSACNSPRFGDTSALHAFEVGASLGVGVAIGKLLFGIGGIALFGLASAISTAFNKPFNNRPKVETEALQKDLQKDMGNPSSNTALEAIIGSSILL